MAAELGSPNAQTYFDQVRTRAYQVDDNGTVSANYQAKSVSQQAIMAVSYTHLKSMTVALLICVPSTERTRGKATVRGLP